MIYEAASHTLGHIQEFATGLLIAIGGCFAFTLLCIFEEKFKKKDDEKRNGKNNL